MVRNVHLVNCMVEAGYHEVAGRVMPDTYLRAGGPPPQSCHVEFVGKDAKGQCWSVVLMVRSGRNEGSSYVYLTATEVRREAISRATHEERVAGYGGLDDTLEYYSDRAKREAWHRLADERAELDGRD